MGYVFSYQDAIAYEQFLNDPQNGYIVDLQNRLMVDLLEPMSGKRALGIGCGTGRILSRLVQMGIQVTGLDPSPYMLDIVKKGLGDRVDLHQGFAEDLPFDDNSYNYVCMVISLEFVEDPQKAIEEACRVAKDRLFLCVMNRYGVKGLQLWINGKMSDTIYSHARFFSIWEMIRIIRGLSGNVPLNWRTVSRFPEGSGKMAHRIGRSRMVQWWPFGTYMGISVTLTPRFRTRPLTIAYSAEP